MSEVYQEAFNGLKGGQLLLNTNVLKIKFKKLRKLENIKVASGDMHKDSVSAECNQQDLICSLKISRQQS